MMSNIYDLIKSYTGFNVFLSYFFIIALIFILIIKGNGESVSKNIFFIALYFCEKI